MVSDKERRMLIRPLMKRRPDLVYHRQYVFIRPLTHYLRGVFFGSGWWGKYFSLSPFVYPLFAGDRYVFVRTTPGLPREERQFEHEIKQTWVNEPELASAEVCDVIENRALPIVADVTSPAALAKRPAYSEFEVDPILGACFDGAFDEAERLVVAHVDRWGGPPPAAHRLDR